MEETAFWRRKTLEQMTTGEWESLCDGCGRCCLVKLEDADTGEVETTNVACRWLDLRTCRCTDYPNRTRNVAGCVQLTPQMTRDTTWLPSTCAYRLIAEGRELYPWHPLLSGDPESVHRAGISVRAKVVSESEVGELETLIEEGFALEDELTPR
ncbi:MAG: YcgN family cysteine cluster protein [Acidobacteriota bacterium]